MKFSPILGTMHLALNITYPYDDSVGRASEYVLNQSVVKI